MKPKKIHKTIRLKGYDYGQDGWYFVTICTHEFDELFGNIDENETMNLNDLGQIVDFEWNKSEEMRLTLYLDTYQIMPNHFHSIMVIGDKNKLPKIANFPNTNGPIAGFKSPKNNVGSILRGFKSTCTKQINELFPTKFANIWQANYYEHIIRNADELYRIRKYISKNPQKWVLDKEDFKRLLEKMKSKKL